MSTALPSFTRRVCTSTAAVLKQAAREIYSLMYGQEVATIRLKLLKIGAVIARNARRVRFLLSSAHPHQDLFRLAIQRLASS